MSTTLNKYVFVSQNTAGLRASGVVWTDAALATIGAGSYFLIEGVTGVEIAWRAELDSRSFTINVSSALPALSPPYLTPFVLAGFAQGNGVVELRPLMRTTGAGSGCVQGWNYSPANDPGTPFLPATGDGVWQLEVTQPAPPNSLRVAG